MSKIKVRQIRSAMKQKNQHKANLKGLGLGRINQERIHENTACIRGMVRKVQHLVEIEEV